MNNRSHSPEAVTNFLPVRLAGALTLGMALLAGPAVAQEEAARAPSNEEVFELSPFQVTVDKDSGYLSTNSTAGTSLNMLIRDIPMSLEVINREMLDDMQATNLEESLIYSAGVFTQNYRANTTATPGFVDRSPSAAGNYNDPFQDTISIRGYNVPNQQRAGFRVGFIHNTAGVIIGGTTDSLLTERVEVVRGPQSLLYGINVLSGITNLEPKRPLAEFGTTATVMVGSDSEFRATLDTTGPVIKDKLNYRFLAGTQKVDDRQGVEFANNEQSTLALQFDWIIQPKTKLFIELVNAKREYRGIGGRSFSTSSNLRDPFGEALNFGRDDASVPLYIPGSGIADDVYFQDHDLTKLGYAAADGVQDGPLVKNPLHEQYYNFEDLGPTFNVSGPDTFKSQEEKNLMAQLYHSFTDNLNLEIGVFHSEVEIEERNISMGTSWSATENMFAPKLPPKFLNTRYLDWQENPENIAMNALTDRLGMGVGEAFMFGTTVLQPSLVESSYYQYNYLAPKPVDGQFDNRLGREDGPINKIWGHYFWYDKPADTESNQFRARLAYRLESELFNVPAVHTFVAGYHWIQDEVNFISGVGGVDRYYSPSPEDNRILRSVGGKPQPYAGQVATDAVHLRNSVFDTEPIRLQSDDVVVNAGTTNYGKLGGLTQDNSTIARSGQREDTLYFRGMYGIYRGQFWNDKLTIIGGFRRDIYQGREKEQLIAVDPGKISDYWVGYSAQTHIPQYIGYGDKPWEWRPDLPDALNAQIEDSINRLRYTTDASGNQVENMVNGTIEHTYAEPQTFDTRSFGISYRIIDPLSVYIAYSEGVFPNVGERDGADDPIGPEQTVSKEIGLRFDLLDGKISGTVSFWRIHRENAVTQWNYAPDPRRFHGGALGSGSNFDAFIFSPLNTYKDRTQVAPPSYALEGGNLPAGDPNVSPYRGGNYVPLNYGVSTRYVELAMEQLGYSSPYYPGTDATKVDYDNLFAAPGEIIDIVNAGRNISKTEGTASDRFVVVDYQKALNGTDPDSNVLKRAFELAMQNALVHGEPTGMMSYTDPKTGVTSEVPNLFSGELVPFAGSGVTWYSYNATELNNPSESHFGIPVPVTFEEEGEGIDGQIIYTPKPNWQLVFNFSHQKRGLTGRGLNLVDPVGIDDQGNMVNWGTEYDVWVYLLGKENFEDPTRPSTYNGASVNGLDLSYVPQNSASILTQYSFKSDLLDGLRIGTGVQWEDEVVTATSIGGNNLQENLYLPPNRPERYVWNAFIRYRWEWADVSWNIQLNVNNILDEWEEVAYSTYTDSLDVPIIRRTLVYYTPRTWRVSLSAKF